MNYYCDHKIPPMKTIAPAETDTVTVSRNLHLAQVAAACNLDVEAVQAMNPQYRAGVVPGNSQPCALRLPVQSIDRFLQLGDSIYNVAPAAEVAERREEVEPAELTAQPNNTTTRQSRRQAWQRNVANVANAGLQLLRNAKSARANARTPKNLRRWTFVKATRSAKLPDETIRLSRSCRKSTTSTVRPSGRAKNSASNNLIACERKHHVLRR